MRRHRTPEYDILREMSPTKKLDVMHSLIRRAYDLKAAAILAAEPDLSSEEVLVRIRKIWARD